MQYDFLIEIIGLHSYSCLLLALIQYENKEKAPKIQNLSTQKTIYFIVCCTGSFARHNYKKKRRFEQMFG